MDFKISNACIKDENIKQKIIDKIKFDNFDKDKEYDISAEFYNRDLIDDSLNEDVSYEIKKEHFKFIKKVRAIFEEEDIKVNKFYLMGTIVGVYEDEVIINIKKSKLQNQKNNKVWPCKEIFIYEDSKTALDTMLYSNEISMEEYESNLANLQEELSIYESEEDFRYLN